MAYDRQYRRQALAKQDLNWSVTDARLYNEAFTGRPHLITRCSFCLQDDHTSSQCPRNPNRPIFGWLPDPATWYGPHTPTPSKLQHGVGHLHSASRFAESRSTVVATTTHALTVVETIHASLAREAPNDRDRGAVLHLRLRDGVHSLSLQARHSGNK